MEIDDDVAEVYRLSLPGSTDGAGGNELRE
jgi:hypothetical protein